MKEPKTNKRDFTDEELQLGIPWIPEPLIDNPSEHSGEEESIMTRLNFLCLKIQSLYLVNKLSPEEAQKMGEEVMFLCRSLVHKGVISQEEYIGMLEAVRM